MNDLYKVVHIEGKNLGCVALKDIKSGTLILQEKSQCVVKPGKYDTETLGPTRLKNLLDSFKQMVKSDQEEYLTLYNRFSVENGHKKEEQSHRKKWLQSCTDFDNEDIETFLKIDGIYVTNGFEMGVGIKAARFNHSCRSNAESGVNDEREIREIKAVSKIKAGEEITINYDDMELSMKSFKSRQDYLFLNWGFHCQCDMCHEEKLDNQDLDYEKFQRLKQDANKLLSENKNLESLELEKICKEIFCYKEMYKLAKEKRAPRSFIVYEILDNGFNAAVQGYLCAQSFCDLQKMAQFKNDCDNFSKVGEQVSKCVSKKTSEEWQNRRQNFDTWIQDAMTNGHSKFVPTNGDHLLNENDLS